MYMPDSSDRRDGDGPKRPRKPGNPGRSSRAGRIPEEDRALLIAAIARGTAAHVAFQMIGTNQRTYRDWRARYERRHPTRRSTPDIDELFADVGQAHARARAAREMAVAEKDPKAWLRHLARSEPGLIGWSEPVQEAALAEAPAAYQASPEEFKQIVRTLHEAMGAADLPEEPEEAKDVES